MNISSSNLFSLVIVDGLTTTKTTTTETTTTETAKTSPLTFFK
jgi:hypothetical protein